jgi:hypothetical protein
LLGPYPQPGFELVDGQGFVVAGFVAVGGAVNIVAPGGGEDGLRAAGRLVRRALKQKQMLEQMREARVPWLLARRPHVERQLHPHQRVGMVFGHEQREAVGQHVFLVRNNDLAGAGRHFFDQPGRWGGRLGAGTGAAAQQYKAPEDG